MDLRTFAHDALQALAGRRNTRVDAVTLAPRMPGLYAFYGGKTGWNQLSLTAAERNALRR